MDDKTFAALLDAANEALAHYKGEKRDLRTTELPEAPEPMTSKEIKQLRERLKVSQAVFAAYLNVSTKLVQAWESGSRRAEGAALRLLRLAERVPALFTRVADEVSIHRVKASAAKTSRAHRRTLQKLAR